MVSSSEAMPLENTTITEQYQKAPPVDIKKHEHDHRRTTEQEEQELPKQDYPVTRQPSLLSLTLDEVQNTVCEPGKTFGSMNMDEFLTNIWTAEEGNTITNATNNDDHSALLESGQSAVVDPEAVGAVSVTPTATVSNGGPAPPPCLPSPLCRKTVDEVWTEIHQEEKQPEKQPGSLDDQQFAGSGGAAPRQQTFGEMTLEDFLIKAGVVREGVVYDPCSTTTTSPPLPHRPYGAVTPPGFSYGGMGGYTGHQQNPVSASNGGYQLHHNNLQSGPAVDGGGYYSRNGNPGDGGFGAGNLGSSTVSPVSSDGFGGAGQIDSTAALWGVDMAATRSGGRKRALDGPVEKVVERRQRRMIKNRESAARSRARKQAYTVELEAELNHLKEENAHLQEEQKRLAAKRQQMILQSLSERARTYSTRSFKTLRRCSTCSW